MVFRDYKGDIEGDSIPIFPSNYLAKDILVGGSMGGLRFLG